MNERLRIPAEFRPRNRVGGGRGNRSFAPHPLRPGRRSAVARPVPELLAAAAWMACVDLGMEEIPSTQ